MCLSKLLKQRFAWVRLLIMQCIHKCSTNLVVWICWTLSTHCALKACSLQNVYWLLFYCTISTRPAEHSTPPRIAQAIESPANRWAFIAILQSPAYIKPIEIRCILEPLDTQSRFPCSLNLSSTFSCSQPYCNLTRFNLLRAVESRIMCCLLPNSIVKFSIEISRIDASLRQTSSPVRSVYTFNLKVARLNMAVFVTLQAPAAPKPPLCA